METKDDDHSQVTASSSLRRRSRQGLEHTESCSSEQAAHLSTQTEKAHKKEQFFQTKLAVLASVIFLWLALWFLFYASRYIPVTWMSRAGITPLVGPGQLDISLRPHDHHARVNKVIDLEWTVTAGFKRPDGVKKRVFLINDEFPGPTIEAQGGDSIRLLVHNHLEDGEEIGLHFHGLHMRDANDMDGAVGFTQCPIRANQSFLYNFTISEAQHGTFWYHAHEQAQRADGLFGGFVVHAADQSSSLLTTRYRDDYDEERLLLVGDWYHRSANAVLAWYMRAGSFGNEPVPDSVIINGSGNFNCSDAVPARPVDCTSTEMENRLSLNIQRGKRYRFRVINTGALAGFSLAMPGIAMTPVEVDGGHALANNGSVKSIGVLYPGERVDIIAEWSHDLDDERPYLQVTLDEENFRYPNPALTIDHRFPVHLSAHNGSSEPFSRPSFNDSFDLVSAVSPLTEDEKKFGETANMTFVLYATTLKLARLSNVPHGFMNHTSWKMQKNPPSPLLLLAPNQWDENQFLPFIPISKQSPLWIDVVINNLDDGSHPFHLHGYDFYVMSIHAGGDSYWGSYNPFDAPNGPPGGPFNLVNPIKRDTVFVPRRGYTVIRFLADNEGIWMFHCHILWHQASGMSMGFRVTSENDSSLAPTTFMNLSHVKQLQDSCEV